MMAAIDAVLFDLDDTLLGNDMDVFLQSYFPLLSAYTRPLLDPDRFLPELLFATQAMIDSQDPDLSNSDVFWRVFCERNKLVRDKMEPFFEAFYREQFGQLQSATERRPAAVDIVRWCFDQGFKVVIATNPLFPLSAIQQRLAWAGIPVDEFDYDLVTGYENMHSAKPHEAYYREILSVVDVDPDRALMVGDDWHNDIVPAAKLGLYTFWMAAPDDFVPEGVTAPDGQGGLDYLFEMLLSGWPAA